MVVDDFLLVAVNDGARDAVLQVFLIQPKDSGKPEPWLKLVQQIPLGGHVATPPLADGRRVLVATSSGIVRIFELGGAEAKTPLRQIAETAIEGADNLIRFPLMQGGQFWIADNRLTKYDVQAARGRLNPSGSRTNKRLPAAAGRRRTGRRLRAAEAGDARAPSCRPGPCRSRNCSGRRSSACRRPASRWFCDDGRTIAVTAGGAVFRIDAGPDGFGRR